MSIGKMAYKDSYNISIDFSKLPENIKKKVLKNYSMLLDAYEKMSDQDKLEIRLE